MHTAIQKFGVSMFFFNVSEKSLLCSSKLYLLFKNTVYIVIVKYYYNLK